MATALGAAAFAFDEGIAPPPDRLVLKDGREIVGRFVAEREHRVYFVDSVAGGTSIPRSTVRTIVRGDAEPDVFVPLVLEPPPEEAPANWVRFEPPKGGRPGRLLTGVGRFFHESTRTTVFLVGAVHIGEPSYYARLQDVLDSCDVVLFEGVGPREGDPAPTADEVARLDALAKLQLTLNDALGLQHQHDGLDYSRDFWRNADVDFASMSERMEQEGVALPTDSPLFRALLEFVVGAFDLSKAGQNPAMRRALRRQAASALAMSDTLLRGELGRLGHVLIDWRNDAALEVLDGELAAGAEGRWVAVFYGAAHLPDLALELGRRGLEFQRSGWIEAWVVE